MTRNVVCSTFRSVVAFFKRRNMNKLLNLYGVKIHSERAFLSFLENSRNEVEAFSSSYIERKVGNLVFSIPADKASTGLNQVIPFLQSSESWHGLVSRPSAEAPQDSVFIRSKIGGNYTRSSLSFFLFKLMLLSTQRSAMRRLSNLPAFSLVLVRNHQSLVHGFRERKKLFNRISARAGSRDKVRPFDLGRLERD